MRVIALTASDVFDVTDAPTWRVEAVTDCCYLECCQRRRRRVAGLVVLPDGEVSWTALDAEYAVVGPMDRFSAHLSSAGWSPTTVRSYAFDLWHLFAFLAQLEVPGTVCCWRI